MDYSWSVVGGGFGGVGKSRIVLHWHCIYLFLITQMEVGKEGEFWFEVVRFLITVPTELPWLFSSQHAILTSSRGWS